MSNEVNSKTAILTEGGTTTQLTVAGITYTGEAYTYADYHYPWPGKDQFVFDILPMSLSASQLSIAEGYTYAFGGALFSGLNTNAIMTSGTLTIEGGTFLNNTYTGRGAAIDISAKANVLVKGSNFSGNTAQEGGAIRNFGTVTIEDTLFASNTATNGYGGAIVQYGGMLRIGGATFSGNVGSNGSAIELLGGTVMITDTITLATANDKFKKDSGSALYTIDFSAFAGNAYYKVIDASTAATQWNTVGFTGNADFDTVTVAEDLYIKAKSGYNFTNAIFTAGGTASELTIGGITYTGVGYDYADKSLAKTFNASTFVYDSYSGAPLIVDAGETYAFGSGLFSGLETNAISSSGTLNIVGGTFLNNTSTTGKGAGIYISATGSLLMNGGTFANNAAKEAGALMIKGGSATVSNTFFAQNSASSGWGGAIQNDGGRLRIGGATFSGNSGTTYGSAICTISGGVTTITDTITLATSGDYLYRNGGTYTIDINNFSDYAYYKVIDASTAKSQWTASGLETAETAGYKAQAVNEDLYIKSKDAKYNFTNAIFTAGGTASELTIGGITYTGVGYDYADKSLAETFNASTFVYDSYSGAPLIVDAGETYAFGSGLFSGLETNAISSSGTLNIVGGTFLNNSYTGTGIGIYVVKGAALIQGSTFSGNSGTEGGAMRINANSDVTVKDTLFFSNTATNGYGGAIVQYGGTLHLGGATFSGNVGSQGSAIALIGGAVLIDDTITLATANDQLRRHAGTYAIDFSAFAGNAYYKVIDASTAATQWNTVGLTGNADFDTVTVAEDLYIKAKSGYNFANAIFSVDGSVTSVTVAGEVVSGVGYTYDDYALATSFGASRYIFVDPTLTTQMTIPVNTEYDYVNATALSFVSSVSGGVFDVTNGRTLKLEGGNFTDNVTTGGFGGVIYNRAGGSVTFSGVTFSGNSATTNNYYGGVISNYGTLTVQNSFFDGNYASFGGAVHSASNATISGSTFTGNCGRDGAAVYAGGNLTIGNTVFDGNSATRDGGALYASGAVTLNGMVTLATNSDTIVGGANSTWTIDSDSSSFNDPGWNKVFNSSNSARWNNVKERVTPDDTKTYETVELGNDLYLHKKGTMIPTAIISASGEVESIVVCGESFSGIGAKTTEMETVRNYGSIETVVDGYISEKGLLGVTQGNFNEDVTVVLTGSTMGKGDDYYSRFYALSGNTTSVSGNVSVLLVNSCVNGYIYASDADNGIISGNLAMTVKDSVLKQSFYGAGDSIVTGDVVITLENTHTDNGKISPTSSATEGTYGRFSINLIDSSAKEIRGTGVSDKVSVGSIAISLTNSYTESITALYASGGAYLGNHVNGPVTVTLVGSTVSGDINRKNDLYTTEFSSTVNLNLAGSNFIGGKIDVDTIKVAGGTTATLYYSGATPIADAVSIESGATLLYNGRSITGTITNNGTFSADGSRRTAGVSYADFSVNGGTFTAVNGARLVGNRAYYYNVVDSGVTAETENVTINGVDTAVISGKNAFATLGDAMNNNQGGILLNSGNYEGSQYANGRHFEIVGGSVGAKQYFHGGASSGNNVFSGDVSVTGTAVAAKGILGGGKVVAAGDYTGAGTSLVVSATGDTLVLERLAGGALVSSPNQVKETANITAAFNSALTVTSKDVQADLAMGGSIVSGYANFTQTGNNLLTITDGTFNTVMGGNFIGYAYASVAVVGTTGVEISGGTFTGNIFGGNVALNGNVTDLSMDVTGTSVTIDASNSNKILFGKNSNITAGNSHCDKNNAATIGSTTVTLKGDADNMVGFQGTIWGDCGGATAYLDGTWTHHTGSSTFVLDDFSGSLNASRIVCFDTWKSTGDTAVAFSKNLNVSGVSHWDIQYSGQDSDTAAITFEGWGTKGDFKDDTFKLTFEDVTALSGDSWVVMQSKTQNALATNFDNFSSVTLFGKNAVKTEVSNDLDTADLLTAIDLGDYCWTTSGEGTNYKLSYQQKSENCFQIVVSKLA